MDPRSVLSVSVLLRFPRARGDGPARSQAPPETRKLPPRSRGWTRSWRWEVGHVWASPALAGMDLITPARAQTFASFPRARGDGPSASRQPSGRLLLPPRSRGWTLVLVGGPHEYQASPALAGMDLRYAPGRARRLRLPRARGDGPQPPRFPVVKSQLPPRSRGWTSSHGRKGSPPTASPALAGMDRQRPAGKATRLSFPRARGDGPLRTAASSSPGWLPPRSRGWTPQPRHPVSSLEASPALAGMDPYPPEPRTRCSCFPRARGDGPAVLSQSSMMESLPPRSRGWTLEQVDGRIPTPASPALAGMDPGLRTAPGSPPRFPRARGDGPHPGPAPLQPRSLPPRSRGWTRRNVIRHPRTNASPALAGMDPQGRRRPLSVVRFPRARGGWTQARQRPRQGPGASPALAGMDPRRRRQRRARPRFPRARGDGPIVNSTSCH